jgi:shikimate kinase
MTGGRALVLIGPMGAGKTSIGRRVARILDRPFTDTDQMVAAEHGEIAGIFAESGEEHFRRLEAAAVRTALAGGGVVALGGGAVLDPGTRGALADHDVVLLTLTPQTAGHRIRSHGRPLLNGADPVARWTAIWREREPVYRSLADLVLDTSDRPIARIAETIAEWTRSRQETA